MSSELDSTSQKNDFESVKLSSSPQQVNELSFFMLGKVSGVGFRYQSRIGEFRRPKNKRYTYGDFDVDTQSYELLGTHDMAPEWMRNKLVFTYSLGLREEPYLQIDPSYKAELLESRLLFATGEFHIPLLVDMELKQFVKRKGLFTTLEGSIGSSVKDERVTQNQAAMALVYYGLTSYFEYQLTAEYGLRSQTSDQFTTKGQDLRVGIGLNFVSDSPYYAK